jgi:hypothetical protein
VTATLARIYREQGFASRALAIYEQLVARHPGESSYRQAVEELRAELSRLSPGGPSVGEDLLVPPAAAPPRPNAAPVVDSPPAAPAHAAEPIRSGEVAESPTDFDRFRRWLDRNKVRS